MDLIPVLTPVRDLGEFIREQRTSAQISIRGLAAKAGVSSPYLSQVERGLRRPSAEILAEVRSGAFPVHPGGGRDHQVGHHHP